MKLRSLSEIESYLKRQAPSEKEQKFPGELGMERMRAFMKSMGDPQNDLKVVHVAGTSGKGSVCTLVSRLLSSHGHTVGLTVSPHMLDIRERVQIDNELISEDSYIGYFNEFYPYIEDMRDYKWGPVTYFEILMAFAYYVFSKEEVDYAVVETGLGGLLDGSNVVDRKDKVCVLTRIGLDHTHVLGETYKEIAVQKAGIVQDENVVVRLDQREEVNKVFKEVCVEKSVSSDIVVSRGKNYKNISAEPAGTIFDYEYSNFTWDSVKVGLVGDYQAENCSLALTALIQISSRDGFDVSESVCRKVLEDINLMGRFTFSSYKGSPIIIDGAHNEQKIESFLSNLKKIVPQEKYVFLLPFKRTRDVRSILSHIVPISSSIVVTKFTTQEQGLVSIAHDPDEIAGIAEELGCSDVVVEKTLKDALEIASEKARGNPVVVTGSLYLIRDIDPLLD